MKKSVSTLSLRFFSYTACMLLVLGCTSTRSNKTETTKPASEQVDIGYGSVDKDHVVGSVSTVEGKDAQVIKPTSVADMLRGRVSGVVVTDLPGGGIRVRIRGSRSLKANNDPLYVIDGMVIQTVDGTLRGINPLDIETITVLKDASATAIYGSRGSNGVILIKTKRG
jgi:TonB-dependent SusC/RagA subfamily outer membrane receptor